MAFASAVALTPIQLTALTDISIATLAAADGTNGNRFVCNRNTIFRVKNGSGAPITVTVHANYSRDGLTLPDKTYSVAATTGDEVITGLTDTFLQSGTNEAWVEYSAVTTVTVQVLQPA